MTTVYRPRPKRWPQFTLRGFFVLLTLAGVLCWLGVQVKWIRDRHAAYKEHLVLGGPDSLTGAISDAPWSIKVLGERGVRQIYITPHVAPFSITRDYLEWTARKRPRLEALFPEAEIRDAVDNRKYYGERLR